MDSYKMLYGMLESALKQAGEENGMLLGQELSIALSDSLATSKTSYFGDLDDGCFVLGVDSGEAYSGQFYLVFSLRDAIVMSSLLIGIPPARVQEKRRLSIMEADDIDAFSEIANMINGALNTVFQNMLPNKVRLKILPPKKYVPEIDEMNSDEPLPDGDYLMFRSKMEMTGQEMHHLDVLIPVPLGDLFDPQTETTDVPVDIEKSPQETQVSPETSSAPDVSPGAVEMPKEPSGEVINGVDSIVVLEDNEVERQLLVDMVGFTEFQIVEGTLDADIKELFTGRNVKLVLIGSHDADDRELAVCIKVNAIRQDFPPPIIMSAERWTRTAVLKALKYGARDIIIKPFNKDDVVAKVRRFCKLLPA